MPIPPNATAIHGITNEQAAAAAPFSDIGPRFLDWLTTTTLDTHSIILVAHNGHRYHFVLMPKQKDLIFVF